MAAKLSAAEDDDVEEEEELNCVRICKTTKGKTLDLSHRKLEVIPAGVLKLTHVQCLYLEDNLLKELPLELAENLSQLTWLDLRHNLLHYLPPSISLLKCLKNLLLEGNQIEKLPVELGLLTKLTGLNLKSNPLEFPPRNIVEQGSKTILKYLRDQFLGINGVKQLNIQESNFEETNRTADYDNNKADDGFQEFSSEKDIAGRHLPSLRRLKLHSAPVHKSGRPKSNSSLSEKYYIQRDSGYMRNEPIESRYCRQVEDAERRIINQKADAIIQKRRNKVILDEWRKETTTLQRIKRRSKSAKHEINMPYGNDVSPPIKIGKDKQDELLNAQLDERIKEHVRNIKEWRSKNKTALTVEEELQATKENLEKAQQLHKVFEKKRAMELRSNTFDVNDYTDNYLKR